MPLKRGLDLSDAEGRQRHRPSSRHFSKASSESRAMGSFSTAGTAYMSQATDSVFNGAKGQLLLYPANQVGEYYSTRSRAVCWMPL